jgi:hypothetical protein
MCALVLASCLSQVGVLRGWAGECMLGPQPVLYQHVCLADCKCSMTHSSNKPQYNDADAAAAGPASVCGGPRLMPMRMLGCCLVEFAWPQVTGPDPSAGLEPNRQLLEDKLTRCDTKAR